jgi:hypothetical protein
MAEPAKTPAVAAAMAEPLEARPGFAKAALHGNGKAGGKGDAKIVPAVDRGKRLKMKPVIAHDKAKMGDDEAAPALEAPTAPVASTISSVASATAAPIAPIAAVAPPTDTKPDEHGERHLLTRPRAADTVAAVAAVAHEHEGHGKHAKAALPAPCLHDAIEVARGTDVEKFSLSQCDGTPAPLAVERLSVLVRPESADKPTMSLDALAKEKGPEIAPGVRKIDAGLAVRLQKVVDHFSKAGQASRIAIISGYRPTSTGSYHATGQAIDLRLEGVKNEELVAFCKTLPDTGCGYYPNSSFVHVDVRAPNTGHVFWIDTSGPGETPHYVASWPPPPPAPESPALSDAREASAKVVAGLDRALPPLPVDAHPAAAEPGDAPAASMQTPIGEEK